MRSVAGVYSTRSAADSAACSATACSKDGRGERRGSPGRVRIGLGFGGSGATSSSASARSFEGDLDVLGRRFFCSFRVVWRVAEGEALATAEASTLLARRFDVDAAVEGRRRATGEVRLESVDADQRFKL